MVDMWGNIPYSEALQGMGNLVPRFDKDSGIYSGSADGKVRSLFSLIDEGLANLANPSSSTPPREAHLIYAGATDKWP